MQDIKQVVVFMLGDIRYGFPIEQVNEIVRYITPTKMPNAPDYLKGIISLRGKVHAVINLRSILGMDKKVMDENTKIIIANNSNSGFIVDDVNMIVTPKEDEIETDTSLPAYIDRNYIQCILKIEGEIVVILNMESIANIGKKAEMAV